MSIRWTVAAAAIMFCTPCCCPAEATYGSVRNGSFNASRTLRPDDPILLALSKANWKTPSNFIFPSDWMPNAGTPGGTLEYVRNGGWQEGPFVKLDGGGHLASCFGAAEPKRPYIGSLRVRGKGKVWLGAYEYGDGGQIGGVTIVQRDVSTDKWQEYRGIYANGNPKVTELNLFVGGQGPVDVDEVHFQSAELADVEITREMMGMYGTGALIENPDFQAIRMDDAYGSRLAEFRAALRKFRENRDKASPALGESIEKKVVAIEPYLSNEGKLTVLTAYHNDMVALTRVLKRQAGADPGPPKPVRVEAAPSGVGYKPGERAVRPNTVTVVDVRSNKVRYNENENATTVATLVNTTSSAIQGTAIAVAIVGLDDSREIARAPLTLNVGANKWSFSYSVGPDTYGRAIEVRFLNGTGTTLDKWQEYYAVAAEWFRVQQFANVAAMKSYKTDPWTTYFNQQHHFASEPTDFGVHAENIDEYLSPQAGYHLSLPGRKAEIAMYKNIGIMCTIYQNVAYAGNMGYEVIRKHPEFALYDANGQFAADSVYGGYPNPMEIASPIEIGPKRKVAKPYLDRKIAPWGHGIVNTARRETIEFEANAVREYAKQLGFDGVYCDGNWGIFTGYGYDGKLNAPPNDHVACMKINARNHRIFAEILQKDKPNFGIWYNWGCNYLEYMLSLGRPAYVGSGGKGDVGDENIRAAASQNSMFLMEIQDTFRKTDVKWTSPAYHLNMLAENRDQLMQKCGANVVMGYLAPWPNPENPGANRWAWPTMNYFGAHFIATQHHFAGAFVPSMRPWLQFMTRYSRYIWAPDLRIVPNVEKIVRVSSPEDVSWKRLVYKLNTANGYDLVVHLVRMPPTEKWDIEWLDEPKPLANVTLRLDVGTDMLRDAWALRPYYYDEDQQPMQTALKVNGNFGSVSVGIPSFRYHTMVVFRIKKTTNK